ncbi:MAG: hypothetical protein J6W81_10435 [Lentisphaeria bacterium]|nr:hypothetical protein [Lentisphaeria bacterium]
MKCSRLAFFDGGTLECIPERELPETILLLRYGKNFYTRNGVRGEFDFSGEDAAVVIADFEERQRDLVIDFEHQSLSGEKAPAAGWIDRLQKSADGLLAHVKYWTDEAKSFLLKGQYRYYSPTLYFSRSGKRVSAIHSTALTNHPAMHGIPALVADDLSCSAESDASDPAVSVLTGQQSDNRKNEMKELLEKLELQAFYDLSEEQQKEALCKRIMELRDMEQHVSEMLKEHSLHDLQAVSDRLEELDGLRSAESVRRAFGDGKLAENMRSWAEDFARRDPEGFAQWSHSAPRIIPENPPIENVPFADQKMYDPEEQRILRMLGIHEKELKKEKSEKEKN